jgi:hypothetical protein
MSCRSRGCVNIPTIYCENCYRNNADLNGDYCEEHDLRAHEHRVARDHVRIAKWKLAIVKEIFSENPSESQMDSDRARNCIVSIPVDKADGKLRLEGCFHSLMDEEDDDTVQPSFISVLGPSGHGKSTLTSIILQTIGGSDRTSATSTSGCHRYRHPIVGDSNSADSTSSDLHLYRGPKVIPSDPIQLFFCDTEGIDGTDLPKMSRNHQSSSSSAQSPPSKSSMSSSSSSNNNSSNLAGGNSKRGANIFKQTLYRIKRRNHVDSSYPKLVYLFSDVICFVTQSHWKENAYLDRLIAWASQGSANIINQGIKPKLIIIFNKIEPSDFTKYDNIEETTSIFFKKMNEIGNADRINELFKYFTNPRILFIPHSKNLIKLSKQIERLNACITEDLLLIRDQRLKSLQLLSIGNFRLCFPIALRCFNEGKAFDFSSFVRTYELNDSMKWLIQLFIKLLKYYGVDKASEIFRKKASLIIVLHFVRKMIKFDTGTTSLLPPLWKETLNGLVERCYEELPCCAKKKFLCKTKGTFFSTCESIKRTHYAGHQSSLTYDVERTWLQWWEGDCAASFSCRWNGPYEQPSNINLNLIEITEDFLHSLKKEWDKEHILQKVFSSLLQDRNDIIPLYESHHNSSSSGGSGGSGSGGGGVAHSSNMCYGCFLSVPTERIDRYHSFCLSCCKLMKNYNSSKCLLCDSPMNWRDIRLAGNRILVLNGNAIRAIQQLFILSQIEEILHLSIISLFDCVISDGISSILSAYLACKSDNCYDITIKDKMKDLVSGIESAYRLVFSSQLLKSKVHEFQNKPDIAISSFSLLLSMVCFNPIYFLDWIRYRFQEHRLVNDDDRSLQLEIYKDDLLSEESNKLLGDHSQPLKPQVSKQHSNRSIHSTTEDGRDSLTAPRDSMVSDYTERVTEVTNPHFSPFPTAMDPSSEALNHDNQPEEVEETPDPMKAIKLCDAIVKTILREKPVTGSTDHSFCHRLMEEKFTSLTKEKKSCDYFVCFGLSSSPPSSSSLFLNKIVHFDLPLFSEETGTGEAQQMARPALQVEKIQKEMEEYLSIPDVHHQLLSLSASLLGSYFYVELMSIADNLSSIVIQIKARQGIPEKTRAYLGKIRVQTLEQEEKDSSIIADVLPTEEEISIGTYVKSSNFSSSDCCEAEFIIGTSHTKQWPFYLDVRIEISLESCHQYVPVSGLPIKIEKSIHLR